MLDPAGAHEHYTRLQRARGVIDPTVKSAFEEVLKRFDSFDAKWEAKFAGAEASTKEHAAEVDRRIIALEDICSGIPATRTRLSSLETFCSDQSEQNVVADDWGRSVEWCLGELEQRADDIELIWFMEIRDKRDDRVAALESATEVFNKWRPWVEASLQDVRVELSRIPRSAPRPAAENTGHPGAVTFIEPASARPPVGGKVDWPKGHCEQGYGSVMTIVHPPDSW